MKITKRAIFLLLCGVIVLALIPIASATTTTTEFGNIADAADDYLNAPDTKFNISSQGLLESSLLGDPYVLSIRKHEHFLNGHIPGAVNMAAASLFQPENMDKLPKNRTIYVYCYTGHTGSQTAALLNLNGYKAVNVKWGMMGWTKDPDVVVASFFTDPATDLPVEARINEPSATYELPQVETDAANEAEAIRLASYNYVSDGFKNISAGDVHELISDDDANNDPVIVSVRSPEDYAKGHIPGAINIPLKDIARGENLQK
ncbi:MAG: rhodanese-like domain-containing protein, partial [Dehalococcoidia bacterium]